MPTHVVGADGDEVKQRLRHNTDAALQLGVFGVPTLALDGLCFWGQDGLEMLRAYLDGDAWFQSGGWAAAASLPTGVQRKT